MYLEGGSRKNYPPSASPRSQKIPRGTFFYEQNTSGRRKTMPVVSLETLKGYFNAGDVPNESNYIDLIDTFGSAIGDYVLLDPAISGDNTIQPTSNIVPLTVKGFVSQTANLQEWKNSVGTIQALMSPRGTLALGKTTINTTSTLQIMPISGMGVDYDIATIGSLTTPLPTNITGTARGLISWVTVSTQTLSSGFGFDQAVIVSGSGVITTGKVIRPLSYVSGTGHITTAYNVYSQIGVTNASGYITSAYHFYAATPIATGTITNAYGLYIENINTAATLNYAIYTNAGDVRFGDDVQIEGFLDINGGFIEVHSASSDPYVNFKTATSEWAVGVDYSDGDKFKINYGGFIGDPSEFEISTSGNVEISGNLNVIGLITSGTVYDFGQTNPSDTTWYSVSATWQMIAGASVQNIDVPTGGRVIISWNADISSSSASYGVHLQIRRDSTSIKQYSDLACYVGGANIRMAYGAVFVDSPSAGNYDYSLYWTAAVGTGHNVTARNMTITVFVLGD